VDVCGQVDSVTFGCGSAAVGTPDFVLRIPAPAGGSTYEIVVPAGWLIQYLPAGSGCTGDSFSCAAVRNGVSGASPSGQWVFAVERAGGGCGRVNIQITRTM
jgi:hypothetical protein